MLHNNRNQEYCQISMPLQDPFIVADVLQQNYEKKVHIIKIYPPARRHRPQQPSMAFNFR